MAYAITIAFLRLILLAVSIDKSIVDSAYMFCVCTMPGLGVMSLVEIDMVIRFQSKLGDGSHEHDVGCLARTDFVQATMPIITVFITICIIGFQFSYMYAKSSITIGLTFTIMQIVCAVMFFSTGFWHRNESERVT